VVCLTSVLVLTCFIAELVTGSSVSFCGVSTSIAFAPPSFVVPSVVLALFASALSIVGVEVVGAFWCLGHHFPLLDWSLPHPTGLAPLPSFPVFPAPCHTHLTVIQLPFPWLRPDHWLYSLWPSTALMFLLNRSVGKLHAWLLLCVLLHCASIAPLVL